MDVRLIVQPGKTVSWQAFSGYPAYSIAVDGYCAGPPRSSPDGLRLNINHHEGCDRIATRSSCAQALHLVKMGLFETFSMKGKPRAHLFVNDCDQDVQWCTYILMHPEHVDRPRLRAAVQLADLMDMSAGFYPIKKRWHLLRRLLWVSAPYTEARADGSLCRMNAAKMESLIEQTHRRIRATLYGRGREIEPDMRFEVLQDFGKWQFIKEIGREARLGLAHKGIQAFVAVVGEPGPVNRVVVMRRSRFVKWFPLDKIFTRLNALEGIAPDDPDRWDGGDNGGGSPRLRLSKLKLEVITNTVGECVEEASEE